MAELTARPYPPGRYPLIIVGTGPGGLQLSYALRRLGIGHAVLSADDQPGGMFLRYPLFQRLNTWSKPHAPADPRTHPYAWFDWNSLVADEPAHRSLVLEFMDGASYFPARTEMAAGLGAFAARVGVDARYGVRWERTRREDDGFVLETSDGEYRTPVVVFAVGMAEPWKPPIPGLERVPHYVEVGPAHTHAGQRVFIVGKRNSGFEVADALLPWARQIILGSPRPPVLSVFAGGAGVRAKYIVPYEDYVLGGGVWILDVAIARVERFADGWRVHTEGRRTGVRTFEVDRVIAATGFAVPLGDLPQLGVATFTQGRLPRMTHFWESPTVPGIYFAGTITQGAPGMRKYGYPGNSAAVGGFRHNARVLAEHLARQRFGLRLPQPRLAPADVVPYLLAQATHAPELLNQRGYLARVVTFDPASGITDAGIVPLAWFVDADGPPAVAMAVEVDSSNEHHPVAYLRHGGSVSEHVLPGGPLPEFEGREHRAALAAVLAGVL